MIAQQTEIKKHTPDEFNPCANSQRAGRWANRKLMDLATATDPLWRKQLIDSYLELLDIGHINGRAGSLLPSPEAASPEAVASKESYAAYERWEQIIGREAASVIQTDTYRRLMAQAVR